MDREIFGAGVSPGAPTTQNEVKLLLCHMLVEARAPMSFQQLYDILSGLELVNYFELREALDALLRAGHIVSSLPDTAGGMYTLTALGQQVVRELSAALPRTIREKAARSAKQTIKRARRLQELLVEIRQENNGFRISLAIPEPTGGELVSLSLYMPTREECENIRRAFLNDPVFLYQGILALLSGDEQAIQQMKRDPEGVF